jgi:hypothetical protein
MRLDRRSERDGQVLRGMQPSAVAPPSIELHDSSQSAGEVLVSRLSFNNRKEEQQ